MTLMLDPTSSSVRRAEAPLHPAQRRYLAEDLVLRRRSDEQRRYTAPQRAAKIDANPHQIDAVIFALSRLREGGCLLADEVGLGKTIEAGLVIAQLLAEGARRVLLVAPKPLLGQWRQELFQLFDLETREGKPRLGGFDGDGIFLVGREAAGSERGRDALLASGPFDLCVIDEAHEVFAGIYKRFDQLGQYKEDAAHAQTAGRMREVLRVGCTPVLLLTATPIQNNLAELWGLVQYVDPLGTLLGDLTTFREVFCGVDDRQLAPGQEEELRGRLQGVLKRTLRRQAQEFLEKPFVERQARLFEYTMSPAEKALYDDVTRYLLEPGILAFRGGQRQLALLGYHRRMASSSRALAVSLKNIVARLRAESAGENPDEVDDLADELEDDELAAPESLAEADSSVFHAAPAALEAEMARVEGFIRRAEALQGDDSRFRALLQALSFVINRARTGKGAGKLVIFTESCVTQEYLRDRLLESRLVTDAEITLFRGANDSPRALQALDRWREAMPPETHDATSADIAMRLALVHEFRTQSRVFISTEAGGKGLNLQFCDTVINYDLPWNPQRIEQRIGRCHRYGQKHDVVVVNFLNRENAADQRVYELLNEKFQLFEGVFGASDEVLGAIGSGVDFEKRIAEIYQNCRTAEDIEDSFKALRAEMEQEIDATMQDTRRTLLEHFDAEVHDRLKINLDRSKEYMNRYERKLWAVTKYELGRDAAFDDDHLTFTLKKPVGPSMPGGFFLGKAGLDGHRYRLGHPLAQHLLDEAANRNLARRHLVFDYSRWEASAAALKPFVGKSGTLSARQLSVTGIDAQDHILLAAITDGEQPLDPAAAMRLFELPVSVGRSDGDPADLNAALGSQFSAILEKLDMQRAEWLQAEMDKLDDWADDKRTGLKADLKKYDDELADLKKQVRLAGSLQEKLNLQRAKQQCEKKRDEAWRTYDGDAKEIEERKERLLDRVAEQLTQDTETTDLFTITFEII